MSRRRWSPRVMTAEPAVDGAAGCLWVFVGVFGCLCVTAFVTVVAGVYLA